MEELWAFNEEMVARSIFESRIPVISAVGHEIDFTIADFVADKRAETPTAAAQLAVPDVRQLKAGLAQLRGELDHRMSSLVKSKELALQSCNIQALASKLENRIHLHQLSIGERQKEMFTHMDNLIYNKRNRIDALRDQLEALNPRKVMERGYSIITDQNGKVIQSIETLQPGDSVIAAVKDGSFAADVTEIRKDK